MCVRARVRVREHLCVYLSKVAHKLHVTGVHTVSSVRDEHLRADAPESGDDVSRGVERSGVREGSREDSSEVWRDQNTKNITCTKHKKVKQRCEQKMTHWTRECQVKTL